MFLFKTILLKFLFIIINSSRTFSQDCAACKKIPKIAMYHLDVQVAKPSDTGETMFQWRQLFWFAKFAQGKLSEVNKTKGNERLFIRILSPK